MADSWADEIMRQQAAGRDTKPPKHDFIVLYLCVYLFVVLPLWSSSCRHFETLCVSRLFESICESCVCVDQSALCYGLECSDRTFCLTNLSFKCKNLYKKHVLQETQTKAESCIFFLFYFF